MKKVHLIHVQKDAASDRCIATISTLDVGDGSGNAGQFRHQNSWRTLPLSEWFSTPENAAQSLCREHHLDGTSAKIETQMVNTSVIKNETDSFWVVGDNTDILAVKKTMSEACSELEDYLCEAGDGFIENTPYGSLRVLGPGQSEISISPMTRDENWRNTQEKYLEIQRFFRSSLD